MWKIQWEANVDAQNAEFEIKSHKKRPISASIIQAEILLAGVKTFPCILTHTQNTHI